jgi:hypothetical protein
MSNDGMFLNSDAQAFAREITGKSLAVRFPVSTPEKPSVFIYRPNGMTVEVVGINEDFKMGKGGTTQRVLVVPAGSAHNKEAPGAWPSLKSISAIPSNLAPATPAQMQAAMPGLKTSQLG